MVYPYEVHIYFLGGLKGINASYNSFLLNHLRLIYGNFLNPHHPPPHLPVPHLTPPSSPSPSPIPISSSPFTHFFPSIPLSHISPFPLPLSFPEGQGLKNKPTTLSEVWKCPAGGFASGWGRGAAVRADLEGAWGSRRNWGNTSCLCLQPDEAGGRCTGQPHVWDLPHGSWLTPSTPLPTPASALPPENPCPCSPPLILGS